MDRFVGFNAVLRTAVLLWYCCTASAQGCGLVDRFLPVVCCCRVYTRVRGFVFVFFSRYIGPALA